MSQKKSLKSAVFDHFTITTDGKYYECQCILEDDDGKRLCNVKISSFTASEKKDAPTRASNLKRHLKRVHPKVFEEVDKKDNIPSTSKKSTVTQAKLSNFFKTDKITITMTPEKFKNLLIEMVVQNSVPITFFSQPAFLGLNGEMARKVAVSLERESIRKLIIDEAKNRKEILRNSLQNRFIFIKMDACTRHRVNYFAINCRYFDENNKIITRTLGVKDTQAHHTSEYLHKLVQEVLDDYKIKNEQILCIVTDNASNMLSLTEKMNKATEESAVLSEEISDFFEIEPDPEDIMVNNINLDDIAETASKAFSIEHMRCAVHTLQLAIRDGLKDQHTATLLAKLRQVAAAARTPKIDAILKRRAGKGIILDQATRWGSTYLMVQRLIELKAVLDDLDNKSVSLTETKWEQTRQLESVLSTPYVVTKMLQAEDLTPGKFFFEWKGLIHKLSNIGGAIAGAIVSSMKRREDQLLNNNILLAAVYVDPMNRILLDSDQTGKAKEKLLEVAIRLKKLQAPEIHESEELKIEICNRSESSSSNDDFNFEAYLDRLERLNVKRRRLNLQKENEPVDIEKSKFKEEFLKQLKEIEKYDRSSTLNVEEAITVYPEIIRDAARSVTAMPPTQVSVERLFSALKIIKTDLRGSMKEDLAEAILFLRAVL